ncbi:hypothetical protein N7512_008020 [Penicillium capsulatum]|nr:hypothetical protein N7512_008020 [Penicillium capsulatum]
MNSTEKAWAYKSYYQPSEDSTSFLDKRANEGTYFRARWYISRQFWVISEVKKKTNDYIRSAEYEAIALISRIKSPYIVETFRRGLESVTDKKRHRATRSIIAFEKLETTAQEAWESGKLQPEPLCKAMMQGLLAAEADGIYHMDLKPRISCRRPRTWDITLSSRLSTGA